MMYNIVIKIINYIGIVIKVYWIWNLFFNGVFVNYKKYNFLFILKKLSLI